jgi:hypothetical protein
MSKQSWHSQLDEIFSDMINEPTHMAFTQNRNLQGWVWECDDHGYYVNCSPEVEEVLGYGQLDFIGQPLTSFALQARSARRIHNLLKMGKLPAEVELDYTTQEGETVAVNMFIFNAVSTVGEHEGLRGFAQVLITQDGKITDIVQDQARPAEGEEAGIPSPSNVEETLEAIQFDLDLDEDRPVSVLEEQIPVIVTPEAEQVEWKSVPTMERPLVQGVSEEILRILERIRKNSPEVNAFEESSVTVVRKEELFEDRTQDPIFNGTLVGRNLFSYPKYAIKEVEHKLAWGKKLDLSEEEKDFILRFKVSKPGLRGRLKRRFARKSILKYDYKWISVVLRVERGEPVHIWVKYNTDIQEPEYFGLEEFLKNPELIYPEILKALRKPWETKQSLFKGKDYYL